MSCGTRLDLLSFHEKNRSNKKDIFDFFFFCPQASSYLHNILNQEGVNKPPLSTLLLLVIHHVSLHVLRGPPGLQTALLSPPYDVLRAPPGRRASDLGLRGPRPNIAADQNSHGRNYTGFGSRFWVWRPRVCDNMSLQAARGEEIRINLRPSLSDVQRNWLYLSETCRVFDFTSCGNQTLIK